MGTHSSNQHNGEANEIKATQYGLGRFVFFASYARELFVPAGAVVRVVELFRYVLLVGVEVAQVLGAFHLRLIGWLYGPGDEAFPFEGGEPGLLLQVLHASRAHRQPLTRLLLAKVLHQILDVWIEAALPPETSPRELHSLLDAL